MKTDRLRRVAAVVLVLAVAGWVTWALVALNGADSPLSAVGPGEGGGIGGRPVSVATLAAGAVLLAAVVAVARRLIRRLGRAPRT